MAVARRPHGSTWQNSCRWQRISCSALQSDSHKRPATELEPKGVKHGGRSATGGAAQHLAWWADRATRRTSVASKKGGVPARQAGRVAPDVASRKDGRQRDDQEGRWLARRVGRTAPRCGPKVWRAGRVPSAWFGVWAAGAAPARWAGREEPQRDE
jgi:hypothetical protein